MAAVERVDATPGHVLLRRAYRDSSLLLEVFTRAHGRVGIIARGARGSRRGGGIGLLQPYRLSWQRRGELATLVQAEHDGPPVPLTGEKVLWVWYANELIMRGLGRDDAHPALYDAYCRLLQQLHVTTTGQRRESPLRRFEWCMLGELGYRPSAPHVPAERYNYDADVGWLPRDEGCMTAAGIAEALQGDFSTADACVAGRALFRAHLSQLVGPQPLKTPAMLRNLRSAGAPKE